MNPSTEPPFFPNQTSTVFFDVALPPTSSFEYQLSDPESVLNENVEISVFFGPASEFLSYNTVTKTLSHTGVGQPGVYRVIVTLSDSNGRRDYYMDIEIVGENEDEADEEAETGELFELVDE